MEYNKILFKGEYLTKGEIIKRYGIGYSSFGKYLRQGFTPEEAVKKVLRNKQRGGRGREIEYKGNFYTLKEISEIAKKSPHYVRTKMNEGFSVEEIIETAIPMNKRKGVEKQDFDIKKGKVVNGYVVKSLDEMIEIGMKRDNPFIF